MPASMEKIGEILESAAFDESTKWVVKWQFRLLGGFQTALAAAICAADEDNLDRLARGFPYQVAGYKNWTRGNLAELLRNEGLNI